MMREHGAGMRGMRLALGAAVLLALAACADVNRFHGYTPSDADLQAVQVGRTTKQGVIEAVGAPVSTGAVGDDTFYYVSSTVRHRGYREPQVVDRQVVAVSFARNGRVSNVERFTLEDGKVVALSRRVTDSGIQGVSLIGQLLRNIGQVNLGQFIRRE